MSSQNTRLRSKYSIQVGCEQTIETVSVITAMLIIVEPVIDPEFWVPLNGVTTVHVHSRLCLELVA